VHDNVEGIRSRPKYPSCLAWEDEAILKGRDTLSILD
jgi:hypothetical protein